MEVKRKFIGKAIMKNFSIKLSWPTQKNMCSFHWHNITQNLIFVFTNREIYEDLFVNNDLAHLT